MEFDTKKVFECSWKCSEMYKKGLSFIQLANGDEDFHYK